MKNTSNTEKLMELEIPKGTLAAEGGLNPQAINSLPKPVNASGAKSLADKLKNGETVIIGRGGSTTDTRGGQTLEIPKGTLAAHWYEASPTLFEAEVSSMRSSVFSNFELGQFQDGSLYWEGIITPGIMPDMSWRVCAVYPHNFPTPTMGGTLRVYLLTPTLEQVEAGLGCLAHHVLPDSAGNRYLCTAHAEDVATIRMGRSSSGYMGALATLLNATKWLSALELVFTGQMSVSDFNTPGRI